MYCWQSASIYNREVNSWYSDNCIDIVTIGLSSLTIILWGSLKIVKFEKSYLKFQISIAVVILAIDILGALRK